MTGGTITKTGDERMIVGHNNGKGFVVHSGGTINVNQNELYIGNENAGASRHLHPQRLRSTKRGERS